MNKKCIKYKISGKCGLKLQCLPENLYTSESQSKVIFDEIFSNIQEEGQCYIFSQSILLFCGTNHTFIDYPYQTVVLITYVTAYFN